MMSYIKNSKIILIYFALSFLLIGRIFFDSGNLLGGDWGAPFTEKQVDMSLSGGAYAWTDQGNLFGMRQTALMSIPVQIIAKIGVFFGINGGLFSKILLFVIFFVAAYSMYFLLKFLKVGERASILGGIIYVTTPIFFNYTIMGWIFVLLFLGLLPLGIKYFIKANQEKRLDYAILVGIIYALSVIQAQALFWFMIVFVLMGFYLIRSKTDFFVYAKNLFIVIVLVILLNSYWMIGLLFTPEVGVSGSDIVNSGISLGTLGNFRPVNIVRLFGSLFNFQYEMVINKSGLLIFSFLLPVAVIFSIFLKKNKRLLISFWLIGSVPFLMYGLNFYRELLLYVPFANVIRDFARFTVLSTFAFVVLAVFTLDYFLNKKYANKKISGGVMVCVCILWFISIFPWWSGALTDWRDGYGSDMRLRIKSFSKEYFDLENDFAKNKLDGKILYLPIGGILNFDDDPKFSGMFQEAQDIFAGYSPIPGVLGLSDRGQGYLTEYIKAIKLGIADGKMVDVSAPTNINYFVIRKNVVFNEKADIISALSSESGLQKYMNEENMIVFKKNNFSPHFYVSDSFLYPRRIVSEIGRIFSENKQFENLAVFFEGQNEGKGEMLFKIKNISDKNDGGKIADVQIPPNPPFPKGEEPVLEFKKINPTKYRVRVHSASGVFPVVFSESYHDGWKAYLAKPNQESRIRKQESSVSNYKILDGNVEDQATSDELKDFINKGYVTTLGNGENKTIEHKKWDSEKQKEELDYVEKYNIDFVSKNFQGTIQNDNLPKGSIFETWMPSKFGDSKTGLPRFARNDKVVELPEEDHLMVNGYANSWVIDTNKICENNSEIATSLDAPRNDSAICVKNPDGSYDFEMVVEFWPQRLFYIGVFISGTTLLVCLGYLGYDWRRRRKSKVDQKVV